jgi:hypothetical protein
MSALYNRHIAQFSALKLVIIVGVRSSIFAYYLGLLNSPYSSYQSMAETLEVVKSATFLQCLEFI